MYPGILRQLLLSELGLFKTMLILLKDLCQQYCCLLSFVEDACLEVCNLSLWNSSGLSEIGPKRRRGWRYFRDRKSMIEWEGAREKGRDMEGDSEVTFTI